MTDPDVLLRDVIAIPEAVHKGDLVFQLADAADKAAQTAAEYEVTDQLVVAFRDAVQLVRSAVQEQSSKAAYLHGSFGSGKSHFMGVLQLLLEGHPAARSIPELAGVVTDIDSWRGDRRFLTVPFHLIGESDLESAVFGQYVRHLAKVHPDAPPPAVYADEPILVNADELRSKVGDGTFFADLSQGAGAGSGWGTMGEAWTADSYDAARKAPSGSADRIRLVQALLTTWLSGYAEVARANAGGYVSFADGLAAISQHAQGLGYGGVVLFLDELILWFLSRLGDTPWVNEQSSKLSKLVEAATAFRPVPIVSIIARQRDLRELVGEDVPGAEKLSFADQLAYQEGRFDTIRLDDSNLPVVAHKRLLEPVDATAAAKLEQAFARLDLSPEVRKALLAEQGDQASFQLTYPFSPAFMTVLVDVAGALQRTRTGLRVLLDLLVGRRDDLRVGQLVPVGDLYDVVDSSDDPFSDAMRSAFDQARKIYRERLLPALLDDHGLGPDDTPTAAFANDDRLVKTLLLAALVPQSVPFKDLTVARLVALNHGLLSSPVPGQETTIAITKLRRWASQAGELQLGSDVNNPTVSVVLSDVDTGSILATADGIDNMANRRTLVKDLVLGALGLPVGQMQSAYPFLWKGLRRDVTLVFGNVRDTNELPDAAFAHQGRVWKVIIDFPFDEQGHSVLEDLERLDRFRQNGSSWSTLCWLPSFFTAQTAELLGRLVRLNHVLANDDRFAEATASLSANARADAKPKLRAMQQTVRSQLDNALLAAYGVVKGDERTIDATMALADHFPSLRTGLDIQAPVNPSLRDALDQVLEQALRHTYPGAPDLQSEVKLSEVHKVAELCTDAVLAPDGRLLVNDSADRRLLTRIANPLQLGMQSEQAFNLQKRADHWDAIFTRAVNQARQQGGGEVTVGQLRAAINHPKPMGLSSPLENLIMLVWAQATSHTFRQHGGPVPGSVDQLGDDWTVVDQPLPNQTAWDRSYERLSAVFGETLPTRTLSGFAVERAGVRLQQLSGERRAGVDGLVGLLTEWCAELGVPDADDDNDRLRTARCAQRLLDAHDAATDDVGRVKALATARVEPSGLALGKSTTTAADLCSRLEAAQLAIIANAAKRPDGADLRQSLVTALLADELVTALAPALQQAQESALRLLSGASSPTGTEGSSSPGAGGVRSEGEEPHGSGAGLQRWTANDIDAAQAKLAELESQGVDPSTVAITLEWDSGVDGG